jgi:GntR family transcriptional regulator, transcriptional repressor for pyruvate dehydrogenase complex
VSAELARTSLSDALTARVLGLIRETNLGPGDRLPSARALAARFEVATPTIREALRRLQATGAIDIRHGSGVYVTAALDRVVLPNPNLPVLAGQQLWQLLDARLLIEPYLAGLAATHRTEAGLAALRATLTAAERHIGGTSEADDAALHEANMAFHRAVATASEHRILHEVMDSLLSVHATEQRHILRLFDDRARDFEEHRTVLEAIEAGDAAQADALMRAHLADVLAVVQRRLGLDGQGAAADPDHPTN